MNCHRLRLPRQVYELARVACQIVQLEFRLVQVRVTELPVTLTDHGPGPLGPMGEVLTEDLVFPLRLFARQVR